MPQAPIELHEQWRSDEAAFDQLGMNFTVEDGIIRPVAGYTPTDMDMSAINYLHLEWDYGFDDGE